MSTRSTVELSDQLLAAAKAEERETLLTVKEYAARYGLHVQTVYSAIRYKRMKHPVVRATGGPRGAIRIAVPANPDQPPARNRQQPQRGIYFVRCGDFVKIGMAADVPARVRALRGSVPFPLTLLACVEISIDESLIAAERRLHDMFAALRQTGEWFKADDELLAFCEDIVSRGSIAAIKDRQLKSA